MTRKTMKRLLLIAVVLGATLGSVTSAFAQYDNDKFDKQERKRAEQGDAKAEWDLGQWYLKGHYHKNAGDVIAMMGTETMGKPKPADAAKWLHKAAENGYVDAPGESALGTMYLGERNYSEAVFWLRRAADHGNTASLVGLGNCYAIGLGVSKDPAAALQWYAKAAGARVQITDGNSEYAVGMAYLGLKEFADAVSWLTRSAQQNDLEAMETLGEMYRDGNGVPKDATVAQGWFNVRLQILNQQAAQAAADKAAADEQKRENREAMFSAFVNAVGQAQANADANATQNSATTTQSSATQQQTNINAALQQQLQAQQAAQARAAAAQAQTSSAAATAQQNSTSQPSGAVGGPNPDDCLGGAKNYKPGVGCLVAGR